MEALFTPPRRYNSPSLRGKKVLGPLPQGEKLWQESLRSDDESPTFGPGLREVRQPSEDELSKMVSVTMRELRRTTTAEASDGAAGESRRTFDGSSENSKQKFIESIVKRALSGMEVPQRLRKSGDSWFSRKSESSFQAVGTPSSRDLSPTSSGRSPRAPDSEDKFLTTERLKEALHVSQEKFRRLEMMYSQLLTTGISEHSNYKRKYEDLRKKYAREQVVCT